MVPRAPLSSWAVSENAITDVLSTTVRCAELTHAAVTASNFFKASMYAAIDARLGAVPAKVTVPVGTGRLAHRAAPCSRPGLALGVDVPVGDAPVDGAPVAADAAEDAPAEAAP